MISPLYLYHSDDTEDEDYSPTSQMYKAPPQAYDKRGLSLVRVVRSRSKRSSPPSPSGVVTSMRVAEGWHLRTWVRNDAKIPIAASRDYILLLYVPTAP